ncbi:metal-dependent phosphohydrolase [Niveibacterium umoris]|uniref:HD-GYP domain-containing protein (C-di-GMP phosphodiesterase class II)/HAMP domain-containing protein n=1 Tax=Niveibacterium umoris TaxID=1193620 RepID=A0A840BJI2_9RHOO|nr:HD domain-containing phosphohydrolase [Niveibacterium umoris]MBB4010717.1 HD-GYP domain-containing protein (c-di-GMP phosphodiesterase class II)/HAMP domain-containing protein [Niveibacterium umoris]
MEQPRRRRFPLYLHISTLFMLLLFAVGTTLAWLSYQRSAQIIEDAVQDVFGRIVRETTSELESTVAPARTAITLLAEQRAVRARNQAERLDSLAYFTRALETSPAATALYVGYDDGDFFLVRKVDDAPTARLLNAPPGTAYAVQSVEREGGQSNGAFLFFDADLKPLGRDARAAYAAYDPRTRPWYAQASASGEVIRTEPYVFFTTGKVGITLARRSMDPHAIVGVDIRLERLAELLKEQKITPGTQLVMFDESRKILAADQIERLVHTDAQGEHPRLVTLEEFGNPAIARLHADDRTPGAERPHAVRAGGRDWHSTSVRVSARNARPLYLGLAVPDDELLAHARSLRRDMLLATALVMLLAIPLTFVVARAIADPLRRLVGEADTIRHFDFARPIQVSSMVQEVDELADTMQHMKRTIQRFLDISRAVAEEDNFDRLLPRLLDETIATSEAQGGLLLLADAGASALEPVALSVEGRTSTLSAAATVSVGTTPLLLRDAISHTNGGARAGNIDSRAIAVFGEQVAPLAPLADAGTAVAVPLFNRAHKLVGAIVLFGATSIDPAKLSFISALSGTAAISLETRELIKAQKALFEAFIRLIASAIDAKSPYTGGHCARVPELTKMLAHAACAANEGPFRDFSLDEGGWEAVHVASWLHDCGKVTTPEFVVDKATKLETIYDRIHEVRMRFEVLKRDAEIRMLRAIQDGADVATAEQERDAQWRTLDDEFAFVAACNQGGEFMAPDKIERLRQIAQRTWLRTLDDRLGISHEEAQRKAAATAAPLPVTEPLLADKPEHRIPRGAGDCMTDDNPWGIRMQAPALLYDRGELSNLTVGRGTLTNEDRYKINDHIVQTIVMLSQLPFPKHLQQVPEIAGGHHEKMDGSGYPKRLTREQMSPVARMMAIADIFEALTAIDRPYKKGKTLSEAIRIMAAMKKDQHIDPDLFELFLRSGVYRAYAERFMAPEYVDAVDVDAVLAAG